MTQHADVIIRTTAEKHRATSLERAIDSILQQEHVITHPIIVANGDRYDPQLLEKLSTRKDLHFEHFSPGSTGKALSRGRALVSAPYFAFLDDDDVLLPDSIWRRLQIFAQDATTDLVVSNGYLVSPDESVRTDIESLADCQQDPLAAIIQQCWLDPCGGLFKTDRMPQELFDAGIDYHEWTYLAFRIAYAARKIAFIDIPLYRRNDTPNSLSKTTEYGDAALKVLALMRNYQLPKHVKALLERKYRAELHLLAKKRHEEGHYLAAWEAHLKSLQPPDTLKYVLFSRKLILPRTKKPNGHQAKP